IGKDLEAMSFASNYHQWIFDEFRPFLGQRIVEVGAGTGSFSELLLSHWAFSLSFIEPSDMYERLLLNVTRWKTNTHIRCYKNGSASVDEGLKMDQTPDSILYINVLEPIPDDEAELAAMYRTLPIGGRIFIFVPALPWLYGAFDRQVGHFRRYTKLELERKCRA